MVHWFSASGDRSPGCGQSSATSQWAQRRRGRSGAVGNTLGQCIPGLRTLEPAAGKSLSAGYKPVATGQVANKFEVAGTAVAAGIAAVAVGTCRAVAGPENPAVVGRLLRRLA